MAEVEKKWYVLRAISGKEAKVKEYLEADIKNSDLGEYVSQVLIPTEKVYQVRNGKKIVKERSYVPGYVLVEAALVGEVAHHLRNTPNVIGFLGGSEKPRNKAIDGCFAPSLRLQQMYSRGDARLEQTFMLEFHTSYFDYYSAPTSSSIIYYYAPAWATDEDIAAWKADDPYGIKKNTLVSKTIADGGIAPSNGAPATYKDRRSQDYGNACIKKFDDYSETSIANRNSTCSMHDVVVARLGETYLIAAEAYLKMGKTEEAAQMINKLRQRPGTIRKGYTTEMTVTSNDINIDFILDERARELAGEYVRWTDLKRTHTLVEYATKYNEDGIKESAMIGPDGKYKILRPIPQAAIDLNQAKVTQNPGY